MIWLLRHAEAEDGSPDAARPLTPDGEAQSRAAGAALKAMGAERELGRGGPGVGGEGAAGPGGEVRGVEGQTENRLSGGRFDLGELTTGFEEVMLVGHDPDFSMVVHEMTGAQVRMKKGGLAGIDRGGLKGLLRPRELAGMGG